MKKEYNKIYILSEEWLVDLQFRRKDS